ncbi:hypothetical protein LXL04_024464 [Taraxacum kok-saghyz]
MRASSKMGLGLRKGAWTADEDILLKNYIEKYGEGKWHLVPLKSGLNRCRKSCRLRWLNYLRPNIKRGNFGEDEVDLILRLHKLLGNRWSLIAGRIPGRTANDVKNYWNTYLRLSSKQQKKIPNGDKSLQDMRVTIFKPEPRSYSKTLKKCMGDYPYIVTHDGDNIRNECADNLNIKSSGLITPSNLVFDHDNVDEFFDSLLVDGKQIDGNFGWSLDGVEEEDDHIRLFNFPLDEVTCDFINFSQI